MDRLDTHENFPAGFREYLENYGWHFSKKMCEFAVGKMKKKDASGKETPITPYSNDEVHQLLKQYGVELKNDVGYNACYVANMAKADFLGSSLPNEQYLAKFVKDYLDDIDGAPTRSMDEYYAKTIAEGIPIIWEDMV